jgi:hypothetical protein
MRTTIAIGLWLIALVVSQSADAVCRCMVLAPNEWAAKATSIHVVKIQQRKLVERFQIKGINRDFTRHEASFQELETIKGAALPFKSIQESGQEFGCEPRFIEGRHYLITVRGELKQKMSFCDALPADETLIAKLRTARVKP